MIPRIRSIAASALPRVSRSRCTEATALEVGGVELGRRQARTSPAGARSACSSSAAARNSARSSGAPGRPSVRCRPASSTQTSPSAVRTPVGTRCSRRGPRRPRARSSQTQLARLETGLVRMRDHRRIEQRGRLDRVLLGEVGADQRGPASETAEPAGNRWATRAKCSRRIPGRSACRSPNRSMVSVRVRVTCVGRHGQHPVDHRVGSGMPLARISWPGRKSLAITRLGSARSTSGDPPEQGSGHRASDSTQGICWKVEIMARVDSAPWFSLRPPVQAVAAATADGSSR